MNPKKIILIQTLGALVLGFLLGFLVANYKMNQSAVNNGAPVGGQILPIPIPVSPDVSSTPTNNQGTSNNAAPAGGQILPLPKGY